MEIESYDHKVVQRLLGYGEADMTELYTGTRQPIGKLKALVDFI